MTKDPIKTAKVQGKSQDTVVVVNRISFYGWFVTALIAFVALFANLGPDMKVGAEAAEFAFNMLSLSALCAGVYAATWAASR